MNPSRSLKISLGLFCLALPLTIAGANLAWGAVLASLAASAWTGSPPSWASCRGPLEKPLWAYLAASAGTSLLGIDPLHSLRYLHQDAHKVWFYYLFSAALAMEHGRALLAPLAAGFAAASLLGLWQGLCAGAVFGASARAHAFVHPVTFGEQTCLAALGAACLLLRPEGPLRKAGVRALAWGLLALLGAALAFSQTRGALLGFTAGLWLVLACYPPTRKYSWFSVAALLAALAAFDLSWADRSLLRDLWSRRASAFSSGQLMRLTLWDVAWRMAKDHPWTGVGLNNYREAFHLYHAGPLEAGQTDWGTAHNLYLHQFAERGAVGLAALAWLLWSFCARALRRAREVPSAWNLWALGTAAAFLVMNLTEVALQTEILWMLVFFIWFWAEALHRDPETAHE